MKPLSFIVTFSVVLLTGCASYVTPGRGVSLTGITDGEIRDRFATKPEAAFPARIAVARLQEPSYSSYQYSPAGSASDAYSVFAADVVKAAATHSDLAKLPMVADLAPINRVLLPKELRTVKDLRLAAASLRADMLLLYSLDTRYEIDNSVIAPMAIIHLGLLPDRAAKVSSTASAALFDVRTGFVYGLAEASANESKIASAWTSSDAIDETRAVAEQKAMDAMVVEFKDMWKRVVEQYAAKPIAAN